MQLFDAWKQFVDVRQEHSAHIVCPLPSYLLVKRQYFQPIRIQFVNHEHPRLTEVEGFLDRTFGKGEVLHKVETDSTFVGVLFAQILNLPHLRVELLSTALVNNKFSSSCRCCEL